MGRPFRPYRRHRASTFVETVATLAVVTFVIVFSSDIGGPGRSVDALVRARPAVQVAAPFPNCGAARAVGADPVYRGDPGYGPHLDGDGDGIGCEPIRYHRY